MTCDHVCPRRMHPVPTPCARESWAWCLSSAASRERTHVSDHTAPTDRRGQAGAEGTRPSCRPARAPRRVGRAGSTLGFEGCLEEAGTSGAHGVQKGLVPEKLGPASLLRCSPQSCPRLHPQEPTILKSARSTVGPPFLKATRGRHSGPWAELLSTTIRLLTKNCPHVTYKPLYLKRIANTDLLNST